jgi:organic radical activating enzyme
MKILRLLVTKECNRNCKGCCNKDWDLDNLPIVNHYNYEEIILTGGEPLLYLDEVTDLIREIRKKSKAKIYLYTAFVENEYDSIFNILNCVDGITLTLHTQKDILPFEKLDKKMQQILEPWTKSLRLNVFKGIEVYTFL